VCVMQVLLSQCQFFRLLVSHLVSFDLFVWFGYDYGYIDYDYDLGSHSACFKLRLAPRRSTSNLKSALKLSLRQPICLISSLLGARGVV
jgi:hypothetical protein